MSAVMLFAIPVYVAMAMAAGLTRSIEVTATDLVLGAIFGAMSVAAYVLNRTAEYRRGAVLLTLTAFISTTAIGLREPDPVRAIYSVMLGVTGAIYASFLLTAMASLWAAVASLLCTLSVVVFNDAVTVSMAVIPFFFSVYVLSLTVAGAALRERQVRELEAGAALLRSTLDASPDAAIIIDRAGTVTEWSLVAARLLGISQLDALGRQLVELVTSEQPSSFESPSAGPRKLAFTANRPDGTTFPCEGELAPLPDGRVAVFLRDVSERKQIEARLMMSDRLETIGRLVAGVAHEINNPLAYVSSNLNFLSAVANGEPADPEEARSVVAETIEGTRRIQTIVQDLRVLSRGGDSETPVALEIEPVLDAVAGVAAHRVREAKARVVRDYGKVGSVLGVEGRLAQVFLNLVINAAQALDEGTARREIILSTRRDGNVVVVSVRDFGPGITDAVRARLFSPFFTTKPAGQGTGLGLYISQSIVTGMKGELRVGWPGLGALFEVVLPAAS